MLCLCGCGQETPIAKINRKERGWIKGEPRKFVNKSHYRWPGSLYKISKKTGCWEWQRYLMPNGYGTLTRNSKVQLAHRYYYEQEFGKIPTGKELDHLCRNRKCVNPNHLEPVTRTENAHRGAKTKLSEDDRNMIQSLKGVLSQRELSKIFKVGRTLIYSIFEKV